MHLLDLFIELVDVGVDVVRELGLLIIQLDHAHLRHFIVKFCHLLLTTLTVSELSIIWENDNFLFDLFMLLALFFSFLFRLCFCFRFFLGFDGSLVLLLATTLVSVGILSIDISLFEITAIVLNVLVSDVEVFLGVFNLLIDDWKDELLGSAQLGVDHVQALIQALDSRDDVLLADAQVVDFDVEVNFDLVDGTFQKDHLLTLLLVVNLLRLRHFIAVVHLEVILAEGALGLFNFSLLLFVLTAVHHFFCSKPVNLLFSKLTLDFPFFPSLVSVSLVDLSLPGLVIRCDGCLCFVFDLSAIGAIVHIVEHLVFTHLILFSRSNLALENLLELINVIGQEVGHLGYSEGCNVSTSAHCLNCELLEV